MKKHPHDPEACVINLDDRIEAIAQLDNKGHHNATTAVFCVARDYKPKLSSGLDSINHPKPAA